jgi:hypothetical protein
MGGRGDGGEMEGDGGGGRGDGGRWRGREGSRKGDLQYVSNIRNIGLLPNLPGRCQKPSETAFSHELCVELCVELAPPNRVTPACDQITIFHALPLRII